MVHIPGYRGPWAEDEAKRQMAELMRPMGAMHNMISTFPVDKNQAPDMVLVDIREKAVELKSALVPFTSGLIVHAALREWPADWAYEIRQLWETGSGLVAFWEKVEGITEVPDWSVLGLEMLQVMVPFMTAISQMRVVMGLPPLQLDE